MTAYYNEIDQDKAAWLRELIRAGVIAAGDVDERAIKDVRPDDLRGYTQCHFFAGIGVWSYALRLAGWPDDRPVWTGSCPCQDLSAAGKKAGFDGARHLWPDWFPLIREQRPIPVFGEQVASPLGLAWLDLVHADLEGEAYTVGAVDSCSAGVGGADIRQRLYWVADAQDADGWPELEAEGARSGRPGSPRDCEVSGMADADGERLEGVGLQLRERGSRPAVPETTGRGEAGRMAHADGERGCRGTAGRGDAGDARLPGEARRLADADGWLEGYGGIQRSGQRGLLEEDRGASIAARRPGPTNGFWRDADWLRCRDGFWRPARPGSFPLVTRAPARLVRMRGYGDAINAEVAAAFIASYLDVKREQSARRTETNG